MTKKDDFKACLMTVLADLQREGLQDGEAMYLLGHLAADLVNDLRGESWSSAKRELTPQTYDMLLRSFTAEGNKYYAQGLVKQAYAVQIMTMSLIAHTQRTDPDVTTGATLLDQIIDRTEATYRRETKKQLS